MSLHEEVVTAIHREIDNFGSVVALSPTSVALAVQAAFGAPGTEAHIRYTSLEHLKHMARRVLAGRFDPEGDENEAHQGEMFSGDLQDRYPVPRKRDEEPLYKQRDAMTADEVEWNVEQLRKSAKARLRHADALEAWNNERRAPAAA